MSLVQASSLSGTVSEFIIPPSDIYGTDGNGPREAARRPS